MNDLIINETRNTPSVEFLQNGQLLIEGRAFSEDPRVFFEPILSWCQSINSTEVDFQIKLDYMNTSATKYMKEIIKTIDANSKVDKKAVKWYYDEDDEDMLEAGQFIEEITLNTEFYFLDELAA